MGYVPHDVTLPNIGKKTDPQTCPNLADLPMPIPQILALDLAEFGNI